MQAAPTDSAFDSNLEPSPSTSSGFEAPTDRRPQHEPAGSASTTVIVARIGWRRRVLLLAAVLGSLSIFLLARALANEAHLAADWRALSGGRLQLSGSPQPELKPHIDKDLLAIAGPDGVFVEFDVLDMTHSSRWMADLDMRRHLDQSRLVASRALDAGQVTLAFSDGARVTVPTTPRGYVSLGATFWLLSAFGLVLYLVGWIVPLVQSNPRNLLYALMAMSQAAQLLVSAVASVPALALPAPLVLHEPAVRTLLDAVTASAILTVCVWYPNPLPGGKFIAGLVWLCTAAFGAIALRPDMSNEWLWSQSLLLGQGLLAIALLSWSYHREPHPFVAAMRRFSVVTVSTLALLSLAVSQMPAMPVDLRPSASAGPIIWSVFFASVVMLMPFVARSQHIMREFAMLAGISTVATSMDLLFIAVFSFSQFTSLTLSLFLSLGVYAAIRQWLVNQMMGARTLTTERMFNHLYRIAREVEAKPERAGERMTELLRNVFEPLEAARTNGRETQSRVTGNGAVLLVPLPNLVDAPTVKGMVALRFAERGKRLFTPEDARLADRIVEQLMRALAHDRAVERGRTEERVRIAQDLHDDIGARLLTLMYKAPTQEMENYVRHTLQDLKTLTRGLAAKSHPLSLAAAEWKTDIAQRLAAAHCELEWHFTLDQDITLSMVQWSSITRVLRELVSNILAHAQANQVSIDCELNQGRFTLRIQDDGKGRTPEAWSHGLGLGGIRKRVKLMSGSVAWRELQPRGIECTVTVPRLTSTTATRST